MPKLVRDAARLALIRRKALGITAQPLLYPDRHAARGEQLLERSLRHLPGGEGVVSNQSRSLRDRDLDCVALDGRAVQHAEVALHRRSRPLAGTEAALAADEKRDSRPEPPVV